MKSLIFSFTLLFSASALASATGDLVNLVRVNSNIYRGGRPTAQGLLQLKNLGVKTDINLQGGDINWSDPAVVAFMSWWEPGETRENIARERAIVSELQMSFEQAPLNSIREVSREDDAAIDRVLEIMNDPARQPVYVHCEHGRDRTGLIIALYRVKYEGWSIADAHAEWAALGHWGVAVYFTGNLDKYFYAKAATLAAP